MPVLSLSDSRTFHELLNNRLLKLFAVSGAPVIRPLLAARGPLSSSARAERRSGGSRRLRAGG